MIFMNRLARSSRATGPKMRVPIGSLIKHSGLTTSQINDPSGRTTVCGIGHSAISTGCVDFVLMPFSRLGQTLLLRFESRSLLSLARFCCCRCLFILRF